MGFITDILKEVPLSAVLKERLADADTKVEALQKENADLRQLVEQKDGQIGTLNKEIERLKETGSRAGSFGSKPPIQGLR